ncbi:MAG: YfiR family protein [Candidatus Cloacimonetes bacterium]|nr:YfiR family protein [Candidatus Cloacimonadota bacterium]
MLVLNKSDWFLLILSLLIPQLVFAQYSEYELKAVYLEKFTHFIEYPKLTTVADTSKPFIIGVIGKNPFADILDNYYKTYKIKNRKVEIKYYSRLSQITGCNLLFIAASEKERLREILSLIKDKPILTVSDSEGFSQAGVHINLYLKDNKLHYELNEGALIKSGFSVWAQLLNSAKIINPVKKEQ